MVLIFLRRPGIYADCARYHYSVEYFEDLRNVNHCEFIIMERNRITGKYLLQSQLRTWSAYKREQEAKRSTIDGENAEASGKDEQPAQLPRRWGGCVNGCNHDKYKWYTYGEPNTNNTNGDNYGKNGRRTPAGETQYLVQQVRERLEVLGAGRDFGGSKSGAGSDADDSGSGSGEEEESRAHIKPLLENVVSATSEPKLGNCGVANGSLESLWLGPVLETAVQVCKFTNMEVVRAVCRKCEKGIKKGTGNNGGLLYLSTFVWLVLYFFSVPNGSVLFCVAPRKFSTVYIQSNFEQSTISVEESAITSKTSHPQPPSSPDRLTSRLDHPTQNTSFISLQCYKITSFTVLLICSLLSLLAGLFLPYIFSTALGADIYNLWTLKFQMAFYGVFNVGLWREWVMYFF